MKILLSKIVQGGLIVLAIVFLIIFIGGGLYSRPEYSINDRFLLTAVFVGGPTLLSYYIWKERQDLYEKSKKNNKKDK